MRLILYAASDFDSSRLLEVKSQINSHAKKQKKSPDGEISRGEERREGGSEGRQSKGKRGSEKKRERQRKGKTQKEKVERE